MKTIPFVLLFAVCAGALVGQGAGVDPALVPIVAVEEQERDLAKAERLYREAIAGGALSQDATIEAWLRLARLYGRLGREQDAKACHAAIEKLGGEVGFDDVTSQPQDAERAKALREKARLLVQQLVKDGLPTGHLAGVAADELVWLGEAAVPEIAAYLESLSKAPGYSPDVVRMFGGVLWRTGGTQAIAVLRQAKDVAATGFLLAEAARNAATPATVAVAEEFLRSKDEDVALAVVRGGAQLFAPAVLGEVFGKGTAKQREWLLQWLAATPQRTFAGMFGVVREALGSTEPKVALAARQLLRNDWMRCDLDAIELVLDRWVQGDFATMTQWPNAALQLDAVRARRWFGKLEACQAGLGVWTGSPAQKWFVAVLAQACQALDASVVPFVLRCLDQGYGCGHVLGGKVDAANAIDVLARWEKVGDRAMLLGSFTTTDLPANLFPALRTLAAATDAQTVKPSLFATVAARTGNPDAAAWLLDGWSREPNAESEDATAWVDALVELGRRSPQEAVFEAMRTMAAKARGDDQSKLYLALLARHDTAALAQMTKDLATHGLVRHPYAKPSEKSSLTPLAYVLYDGVDPPHGFTLAERLAFARTIAAWEDAIRDDAPSRRLREKRVPTELVLALAEHSGQGWGNRGAINGWFTWCRVAAERMAEEEAMDGPIHRWWQQQLQTTPQRVAWEHLSERDLRHFRASFEAWFTGDDEDLAVRAYEVLRRIDPLDLVALTRSKHGKLAGLAFDQAMASGVLPVADALRGLTTRPRERDSIAKYCGAKVAVEAVPALLQLLQDPEPHVRERAAEALTRIRFHHEQQAYWERITKGLDASPQSAAEKLLLQGKPGAPKAQRLLAITSLGTLGLPEALPFLIEWTQDADAEVAQRAKDAITQIHLQPRR